MRRRHWLALGIAVVLLVPGCSSDTPAEDGSNAGLTQVTFRLDWLVDTSHVCFYASLSKGYFRDEGLDVEILEGAGSGTAARLVANGSNDFGWADAGVVVKSINEGAPIKLVAVGFQRNPSVILSLKEKGINRPQDLAGKSVGASAGEAPVQLLPAYLGGNGVDPAGVRIINMDPAAKVPALLQKRVDAIVGYSTTEPIFAESQAPGQLVVQRYADYGVVALSNGVVTSRKMIDERPAVVGAFVKAVQRGFEFCQTDPDEAVRLLADRFPQSIKADQAEAGLREIMTLIHTDRSKGKPVGYADPQDWADTLTNLRQHMGLKEVKPVTEYYADQFTK